MSSPLLPSSSSQAHMLNNHAYSGGGGGILSRLGQVFNLNNFKQLIIFILNSTILVKSLCICVLVGYLMSHNETFAQYLSVVPGKLLPPNYFIWSLFSHSFIEFNLVELFADWFIVLLYSKMLEPLWGTLECLQFYLLITTLTAVASSLVYFVCFAATFNETYLFEIYIHGMGGLLGGLSVAMKQIMPDTILFSSSFMRFRQDHVPLMLVFISLVLYAVSLTNMTYIVTLVSGILIGWIYLRFYQKHKNGSRGDSSSSFVFVSFFPSQIQPFVAILSNTIFNLFVKLKLCKPPQKRYNVSSMGSSNLTSGSHVTIQLPILGTSSATATDNSDAERRRLKALKALKERLKKPNDDEDVSGQWGERNSIEDDDQSEQQKKEQQQQQQQVDLSETKTSNSTGQTADVGSFSNVNTSN